MDEAIIHTNTQEENHMPFITLTTDMGLKDHYVASLKAYLMRSCPSVPILDITHEIECFDVNQAAFTLRSVIDEFDEGTVHIVGVRPESDSEVDHLLVKHKGQYILAADNGIFHLLLDREPEDVYVLNLRQDTDFLGFPTKHVLAKAAIHLIKGGTPEIIARRGEIKNRRIRLHPILAPSMIKGHVMHVDRYENAITNIEKQVISEVGKGRAFIIDFGGVQIKKLSTRYQDVHEGVVAAVFSDQGLLEIGINGGMVNNGGGASSLLGLKRDDIVRIDFK